MVQINRDLNNYKCQKSNKEKLSIFHLWLNKIKKEKKEFKRNIIFVELLCKIKNIVFFCLNQKEIAFLRPKLQKIVLLLCMKLGSKILVQKLERKSSYYSNSLLVT